MFACPGTTVGGAPLAPRGFPHLALCRFHLLTLLLSLFSWPSDHRLLHHHNATLQVKITRQRHDHSVCRSAPESLQSSHYSLLSTMEVAGKLAFASVSGIIIDIFGLQVKEVNKVFDQTSQVVLLLLLFFALLTPPLVPNQETPSTSDSKRL